MKYIFCLCVMFICIISSSFAKELDINLLACTTPEQESILGYKIRMIEISGQKFIIIEKNVISNTGSVSTSITVTPIK